MARNNALKFKGYRFHGDGLFIFAITHPSGGLATGRGLIENFFRTALVCDFILLVAYAVLMALHVTSFKCLTVDNIVLWHLHALRCAS